MDIAFLFFGSLVGFGIGVTLKRNNIKLISNYYDMDMGILGKRYYTSKV